MPEKELGPWREADYDVTVVAAIQALERGEASPEQQIQALKWIVESAAGLYEQSFWPGADGDRNTAFAEGKRFVGNTIVKMTRLNMMALKERRE